MSDTTGPRETYSDSYTVIDRLQVSRAALARNWGLLLALGVLWLILGALAIILPLAAAIAIDITLGVLFLIGGVMQLVQVARCRGWRSVLPHALGGVLSVAAGVLLLFFPLAGVLSLTLIIAALFIIGGVFRIVIAAQNREIRGWFWMMLSGLLGLVVGVLIWIGWPASSVWVLGLLVGIELIFEGWAMIMLAVAARQWRGAQPPRDVASPTPA
jgi:uncharacterized membrane protein HdeD (DUF308 family)